MDDAQPPGSRSRLAASEDDGGRTRARTWVVAVYHDPSEYGIPELSAWTVVDDRDGIALAAGDDAEPFIRGPRPMTVRR